MSALNVLCAQLTRDLFAIDKFLLYHVCIMCFFILHLYVSLNVSLLCEFTVCCKVQHDSFLLQKCDDNNDDVAVAVAAAVAYGRPPIYLYGITSFNFQRILS